MARRPLVATVVTTGIGAVLGALLGAGVGRVIALLGDETIQPSVPMAFCATIGFFIGSPAAAKGSLDRFGGARASLGGALAAVIVIVLVGGANLLRVGGIALFGVAAGATLLAAVAATAVGRPQERPVVAAPARVSIESDVEPKPAASSAEEADDRSFVDWARDPEPEPEPEPEASARPRRREPLRVVRDEPAPEPTTDESARPRRERPLRRGDADS